ncbi:MAG: MlaC/ttg2D family ABC transporter substrate-binding protein [bacterium]
MFQKLTAGFLNQGIFGLLVLLMSLAVQGAESSAAAEKVTPHQIVEGVSEKLLGIIAQHRDEYEANPEPFLNDLNAVLDDVVDFSFIARNVMGPFGKKASPEQLQKFEQAFRADLIETYARGLFSYGDQEIVVIPSDDDLSGKRRVTVYQEIRGNGETYPLNYSMGLNRDGQWKVTNLIINGINLGKTFRNQFLQRARELNGDIDQVIDNWSASENA